MSRISHFPLAGGVTLNCSGALGSGDLRSRLGLSASPLAPWDPDPAPAQLGVASAPHLPAHKTITLRMCTLRFSFALLFTACSPSRRADALASAAQTPLPPPPSSLSTTLQRADASAAQTSATVPPPQSLPRTAPPRFPRQRCSSLAWHRAWAPMRHLVMAPSTQMAPSTRPRPSKTSAARGCAGRRGSLPRPSTACLGPIVFPLPFEPSVLGASSGPPGSGSALGGPRLGLPLQSTPTSLL
jgi:hypothetical protein